MTPSGELYSDECAPSRYESFYNLFVRCLDRRAAQVLEGKGIIIYFVAARPCEQITRPGHGKRKRQIGAFGELIPITMLREIDVYYFLIQSELIWRFTLS